MHFINVFDWFLTKITGNLAEENLIFYEPSIRTMVFYRGYVLEDLHYFQVFNVVQALEPHEAPVIDSLFVARLTHKYGGRGVLHTRWGPLHVRGELPIMILKLWEV